MSIKNRNVHSQKQLNPEQLRSNVTKGENIEEFNFNADIVDMKPTLVDVPKKLAETINGEDNPKRRSPQGFMS